MFLFSRDLLRCSGEGSGETFTLTSMAFRKVSRFLGSGSRLSINPTLSRPLGASYHTRAHPKPIPTFPLPNAVDYVLTDCSARNKRKIKSEKWLQKVCEFKKVKPRKKRTHNVDETVELAVNLNLDPRKPGQSLRGSLALPHGTGKKGQSVAVFTEDEEFKERAQQAGALHVGGSSLVEDVVSGRLPVDSFQVALATPDMLPILTKAGAARILGPRGLMPNKKVGTVLDGPETMVEQIETYQAAKQVMYRTEKEGIVHLPVGKVSFGKEKLLDNIGEVMKAIFDVKPESYGKGKKKKASKQQPQYLLSASLSATQGKGFRVDVRTIDPSSAFFLSDVDPLKQKKPVAAA